MESFIKPVGQYFSDEISYRCNLLKETYFGMSYDLINS
jgi:hypothetical protein